MAAQSKGKGKGAGGLKDAGSEALRLAVAYVKQETLDPLRGLGRFILWGIVGSVAVAAGLVIVVVGLLRLLQGETGSSFQGNLSWIPYLICTVVVLGVAGLAGMAIVRGQRGGNPSKEK